jgi:BirA family transcriptional regulator, biotin operon repressor / biotin---[acetyl-CoA-carboxylase] ligase
MVAPPRVHRHEVVDSTMDLAHRLAERGVPTGTAVVAAEQTGGRGSRGRAWRSPRGGLWMTMVLRPGRAGGELLSLRAGLAVAEAVEQTAAGTSVGLKWPNDLMLDDRKLGGVLCEARWVNDAPAWVAVGVGLNVHNPIPAELAAVAVGLAARGGAPALDELLEAVLPRLRAIDLGATRLSGAELGALQSRDWLRGRRLAAPFQGVAEGIDDDGSLLIRRHDGTLGAVRAGTVELADRAVRP